MFNVGTTDRIIRGIFGVALIAFGLWDTTEWRWIGVIGPVLVATAVLRFCPAYWLLKISTFLSREVSRN